MAIEWDPNKAAANLKAHGVAFSEAATVLLDECALSREDPDAIGEQRFVALGMSATGALLVVEPLAKLPRCELLRRSIRSPGAIFVASEACPAERLT